MTFFSKIAGQAGAISLLLATLTTASAGLVSTSAEAQEYYPRQAASWGGKLRSGPGMNYGQVGSLYEGNQITILQNSGQWMNGYPWFRIRTASGQVAYQWGGIMCGMGENVPGLHKQCNTYGGSNSYNNQHNAGYGQHNSGQVHNGGQGDGHADGQDHVENTWYQGNHNKRGHNNGHGRQYANNGSGYTDYVQYNNHDDGYRYDNSDGHLLRGTHYSGY